MNSWHRHILKHFLFMSGGFGLSMLLAYRIIDKEWLWSAIPLGMIYGLLVTFFSMRRLRARLRAAGIEEPLGTLDFSPEQRATVDSPFAPAALPDRLKQDLNFRFTEIKQTGDTFLLKTASSQYTLGERVTFQAEALPNGLYRYHLHSRPRWRWQLSDTANGLLLVRALQRLLQDPVPVKT